MPLASRLQRSRTWGRPARRLQLLGRNNTAGHIAALDWNMISHPSVVIVRGIDVGEVWGK